MRDADFNPRAPCGARLHRGPDPQVHRRISIHAPLAGRDGKVGKRTMAVNGFQSTRPLRGATYQCISKHGRIGISIHAPLAGRDVISHFISAFNKLFQSTRPLRGATPFYCLSCRRGFYFNPRAPCGARQGFDMDSLIPTEISIHAPLAGRDRSGRRADFPRHYFNPRAPCGARRYI